MTELAREAFLAEREDQRQKLASRMELRRMVMAKERQEGGQAEDDDDDDEEAGNRRTGRDRNASSSTKTKGKALEAMKKKRAARAKREVRILVWEHFLCLSVTDTVCYSRRRTRITRVSRRKTPRMTTKTTTRTRVSG